MDIVLLFVFILIGAIDASAFIAILSKRGSGLLRLYYFCFVLVICAASWLMTDKYSYYSNPNTHVFGWPIPTVIFQRDTLTSPWLDYVGPTVILAYPMNFIIFMFIPSIVFAVLTVRRQKQARTP